MKHRNRWVAKCRLPFLLLVLVALWTPWSKVHQQPAPVAFLSTRAPHSTSPNSPSEISLQLPDDYHQQETPRVHISNSKIKSTFSDLTSDAPSTQRKDLPSSFVVDAVVTFVSSNDPLWRSEYASAERAENRIGGLTSHEGEFTDYGEWRYVLKSIGTYAPWIRRVFFVVSTDSQVPKELRDTKTLSHFLGEDRAGDFVIVTHEELCESALRSYATSSTPQFESCSSVLPTFKSRVVEYLMLFADGLSEHFLYFNNDMVLALPTKPEDFFTRARPNRQYQRRGRSSATVIVPRVFVEPHEVGAVVVHRRLKPRLLSAWEQSVQFNEELLQQDDLLSTKGDGGSSKDRLPFAHLPRAMMKTDFELFLRSGVFGAALRRMLDGSKFRQRKDLLLVLLHGYWVRSRFRPLSVDAPIVSTVVFDSEERALMNNTLSYHFAMLSSEAEVNSLIVQFRQKRISCKVLTVNDNWPFAPSDEERVRERRRQLTTELLHIATDLEA